MLQGGEEDEGKGEDSYEHDVMQYDVMMVGKEVEF